MAIASGVSLDRLRRDGQAFSEEISREYYLAAAGLKLTAELQPIYGKYAAIMSADALGKTLDAFRAATPGSEEHRKTRILLEWLAGLQAGRELAPLEEREIAWEASAMVPLPDGSRMQFERVPIEVANSTDRAHRVTIHEARNALVSSELAPMRRERFQRERDIIERCQRAAGRHLQRPVDRELAQRHRDGRRSARRARALRVDVRAAWRSRPRALGCPNAGSVRLSRARCSSTRWRSRPLPNAWCFRGQSRCRCILNTSGRRIMP